MKRKNNSLPFLDILISRLENSFWKSVYHKPSFSWVTFELKYFHFRPIQIGVVFTFIFQTFSVVSDFSRFYTEISHLKEVLKLHVIPIKLTDNCVKKFLNKTFLHTSVTLYVKKKELLSHHTLLICTSVKNKVTK